MFASFSIRFQNALGMYSIDSDRKVEDLIKKVLTTNGHPEDDWVHYVLFGVLMTHDHDVSCKELGKLVGSHNVLILKDTRIKIKVKYNQRESSYKLSAKSTAKDLKIWAMKEFDVTGDCTLYLGDFIDDDTNVKELEGEIVELRKSPVLPEIVLVKEDLPSYLKISPGINLLTRCENPVCKTYAGGVAVVHLGYGHYNLEEREFDCHCDSYVGDILAVIVRDGYFETNQGVATKMDKDSSITTLEGVEWIDCTPTIIKLALA
nr:hypothetical protein K-LCC10_0006 [Kaumoebavirus]